jgi:hypothetical protein
MQKSINVKMIGAHGQCATRLMAVAKKIALSVTFQGLKTVG